MRFVVRYVLTACIIAGLLLLYAYYALPYGEPLRYLGSRIG